MQHSGVPLRCVVAERAGVFLSGSGAFGEMVRLRLELAAAVGAWGLDLVLCDADTLWLRDPSDFFDMCAPRPRRAPSGRAAARRDSAAPHARMRCSSIQDSMGRRGRVKTLGVPAM